MKKFLLFCFLFLGILNAKAQEGFPDPAYGTGGILTTDIAAIGDFDGSGRLVAGKLNGNILTFTRYTAEGSLDLSFGSGGTVQQNIGTLHFFNAGQGYLGSLEQTSDGRIVIALGRINNVSGPNRGVNFVIRFGSDGKIDSSFGSAGSIGHPSIIGSGGVEVSSVGATVLENDRVLYTQRNTQVGSSSLRVLYSADGGSIIPLSTTQPEKPTPASTLTGASVPGAFFLQPDGKMIITNSQLFAANDGNATRFNTTVINRLYPDGSLDSAFGDNGAIQFNYIFSANRVGPGVPTQALAVQPNGQLLMATQYGDSILRVNTSGAIDLGFAIVPQYSVSRVLVQPDGKIIISGRSLQAGTDNNFTVARYNPDSTPDASFGNGGITITPLGPLGPGGRVNTITAMSIVVNRLYVYGMDATLPGKAVAYQLPSLTPPFVRGEGCPPDTLITLPSCDATTTVTWPVPADSFPTIIPIPSGVYPDGSIYYGEGRLALLGTLGGHGYYRSADAYQSYSWTQANTISTSVGGHLTTITSEAENDFILSKVQSTGYFSWIGLQRTGAGPAQFSWVTGEPLNYTNWGGEDPNNGGSTTTIAEPYVFMYEGWGTWHDLIDYSLPFQVEYDAAPIRWRQISGPANGSSLGAGVYPVCYERFNSITNQKDTCCFTITVQCGGPAIPTITTFSPASGPVGTTVVISGFNFDPVAQNNIVYFGAVKATVTSATPTSITVTVPVGTTYQPITVTRSGLVASSTKPFNVTFDGCRGYLTNSFAEKKDFQIMASFTNESRAISDLDGDGKPDLVTGNGILRNTGAPGNISFAPHVAFPIPENIAVNNNSYPQDIAIGDLNGDSKPDLVATDGFNLFVFRNTSTTGTISFTEDITLHPFSAGRIGGFRISDVDSDGKLDLAVSNIIQTFSSITFKNYLVKNISTQGTIAFAGATELPGGVFGDLDGDGKPDLLATGNRILRNTSTSGVMAFTDAGVFPALNSPSNLADLDGDDKPDLVTGTMFLRNTSSGGTVSFAPGVAYSGLPYLGLPFVGDWDGDGKPDLAITNPAPALITLFKNTSRPGMISFGDGIDYQPISSPPGNGGLLPPGDFDGDGKPDLAVVATYSSSPLVSFFRNQIGDVPCNPPPVFSPPLVTSFSPVAGTVGATVVITGANFDPVAQNNIVYFGAVKAAVTAATPTSLTVIVPTGTTYKPITVTTINSRLTGYSSKPFNVTFPNSSVGFSPGSFSRKVFTAAPNFFDISDLDGDSKPDVAAGRRFSTANLFIFKNTSTGGEVSLPFDPSQWNAPIGFVSGVTASDLDGDGKPDLVGSGDNFIVSKNISTAGNFYWYYPLYVGTGPGTTEIPIIDVDGDGKPDLISTNGSTFSVTRNKSTNGIISFAPRTSFFTGAMGSYTTCIAAGDLDGDGKPDLAMTTSSTTVSIFRNTSFVGTFSFAEKIDLPLTDESKFLMADFDGDGKLDLFAGGGIFRNTSTPGSLSFAPVINFSSPGTEVAAGDLDGDGKPDLVTAFRGSSTLRVFRNVSTSGIIAFAEPVNYRTGQAGDVAIMAIAIADLNEDGRPEIAAAHTSTAFVVLVNQMQGPCAQPTFLNDESIVRHACRGLSDGAITLIPTSGTSLFQYSIDGGSTYVSGPDAGQTFENLLAGTYQLRLKDASGCRSEMVEKVVTNDGPCTEVNSRTLSTKITDLLSTGKETVGVSPNPSKGQFTLRFENFAASKADVSVLDAKGVVVQKRSLGLTKNTAVAFDLSSQAKGLYFVQIFSSGGTRVVKVLIQ